MTTEVCKMHISGPCSRPIKPESLPRGPGIAFLWQAPSFKIKFKSLSWKTVPLCLLFRVKGKRWVSKSCLLQDYKAVFLFHISKLTAVLQFSCFGFSLLPFWHPCTVSSQTFSSLSPTKQWMQTNQQWQYGRISSQNLYSVFCMDPCIVLTFIKKWSFWTYFISCGKYFLPLFHALYLELSPLKFHLQINCVILNLNFSPNLCQTGIPWICLPCPKFRALLNIPMTPRPGWEHSSLPAAITHVDIGSI